MARVATIHGNCTPAGTCMDLHAFTSVRAHEMADSLASRAPITCVGDGQSGYIQAVGDSSTWSDTVIEEITTGGWGVFEYGT